MKEGVRCADDAIYLNEDRLSRPKEVFKRIGDLIAARGRQGVTVADVGCATGEFVGYLAQRFPTNAYTGFDVSAPMVERAGQTLPGATFRVGSILEGQSLGRQAFDIVVNSGVICIFDDVELPLRNLVECARPGGQVYILAPFNDAPVDVIMRYRLAEGDAGLWQSGWNVHSKATVERLLRGMGQVTGWTWHPFDMPFALPKREDPMRTWTIGTEAKPFQTVNGACQILDNYILAIEIGED